jgi:hypothetical protein
LKEKLAELDERGILGVGLLDLYYLEHIF